MGNKFLALRKSEVAKVAPDRAALMGKVSQEMADMKTIREADRRWLCLLFGEPYEAEYVPVCFIVDDEMIRATKAQKGRNSHYI